VAGVPAVPCVGPMSEPSSLCAGGTAAAGRVCPAPTGRGAQPTSFRRPSGRRRARPAAPGHTPPHC